ncbi:MAG: hypothetical protein LBV23_05510, partial [Deltaproteobacteria bacterium]|nr:hypothetical protein [Deltaproteobacteria bacterium]
LDRPFSIHRSFNHGLEILIRKVGWATTILSSLKSADRLTLTGPLGRGLDEVFSDFSKNKWYLLAGGAGLGPMGSIVAALGAKAQLIYAEKNACRQVNQDFLFSLTSKSSPITEDGSGYGKKGSILDYLESFIEREPRPVFACGPQSMLKAVWTLSQRLNFNLFVSLEAFMACGLGVCLSCSLPGSFPYRPTGRFRVCQEGPVVCASLVDWNFR